MDIRSIIREFIKESFLFHDEDSKAGDSVSFLESGIVDSTGILEIVEFVEEKFCISIADDELVPENLDSIENLTRFVKSKVDEGEKGQWAV